ncbi:MAG: RnfH family protein [Pseudomonadota bacterium]|nr:RnfH family protein [Pseudomonadota bacterium]
MSERIAIEVVFALPGGQEVAEVVLDAPCTVREAVQRSGILDRYPEIDLDRNPLGIFGRRRSPDWLIEDLDRIEIYRSLRLSPVEARRLRAEKRRE